MTTKFHVRDIWHAIRLSPPLSPDDSLARAARLFRARNTPVLLVARDQQLIGAVYEADLLEVTLEAPDAPGLMRATPVTHAMRPIDLILSPEQRLTDAAREMAQVGAAVAPVADGGCRYLGLLFRRDLLAAMSGEPVVPTIAGLATPFGVHLTTGALRAGASDLALASTGVALMVMNFLALGAVDALQRYLPAVNHLASAGATAGVTAAVLGALQILLFLVMLRVSAISGIHAGEHMVVRAIEEGEDLNLKKVRPMPREHPRCGTNLVALLVLISGAWSILDEIQKRDPAIADILLLALMIVVLFTWRRLGQGLQRWITTRDPSDRQLAGAIAVGEDLLEKVSADPGRPAKPWRRLWNMGFLQVLAGAAVVQGAVYLGTLAVGRFLH